MDDNTILNYKLANPAGINGFNPSLRIVWEDVSDYMVEIPRGFIRILTDASPPLRGV